MCGFLGLADSLGRVIDDPALKHCRDLLRHRGPDSAGDYQDSQLYLGFRRLAILDLTPLGNQPMSTDDGQLWIVFNGEIYNHVELRQGLEQKGHRFRSSSDTEVLLHLFSEHGTQMFERLNGMFAMAVYDRQKKTVTLARDRLGKKPLFYWPHHRALGFASELRALRALPGFPTELDNSAVALYFRLGWVPGWACIHPGVKKLPPATWLKFSLTTGEIEGPKRFWSLPPVEVKKGISENVWVDRIEALLWDATAIRLRSDVPLGVFLSGGIDSALITAAAAKQLQGNLTSLTIGFPDWADNEWPFAQATAEHLRIQALHEEMRADGVQMLPGILGHFDEPFADGSALPTSLVCQTARRHLTVALSGDGGDELFAGYENHVRARYWSFLDGIPASMRRQFSLAATPYTSADSRIRRFFRRLCYDVGTFGMGGKLYPFEDWVEVCVRPEFRITVDDMGRLCEERIDKWPGADALDQAQRTDIQLYLADDILVKVDRMSMRHSLEVRSPFLDHRVVELAMQIPSALRIPYGQNKHLLRRLAERHLPLQVTHAPKRGFGIPLGDWLFRSQYTSELKKIIMNGSHSAPDPLLPDGPARLWQMAERNVALHPALFRVLAYRWWQQSLSSQEPSRAPAFHH